MVISPLQAVNIFLKKEQEHFHHLTKVNLSGQWQHYTIIEALKDDDLLHRVAFHLKNCPIYTFSEMDITEQEQDVCEQFVSLVRYLIRVQAQAQGHPIP